MRPYTWKVLICVLEVFSLFIRHVSIISNVSVLFLPEKAFSLLKTFKEVISELQGEIFLKYCKSRNLMYYKFQK